MKNLKAKMKKQAGFTLIEMLIVVAIVAILVAISIPLVGSALESARDATDQANERAAKMAAVATYMSKDTKIIEAAEGVTVAADGSFEAFYDADKGVLKGDKTDITGYGKCKAGSHYGSATTGTHENLVIKATVTDKGVVTLTWE